MSIKLIWYDKKDILTVTYLGGLSINHYFIRMQIIKISKFEKDGVEFMEILTATSKDVYKCEEWLFD